MNRAVFFYGRKPDEKLVGKTRIGKSVGDQKAANELAKALILDMYDEYRPKNGEYDFITPEKMPEIELENVGKGMENVFRALTKKYDQVIIVGSDIPSITKDYLLDAFSSLQNCDAIIYPADDMGYGLIGMNKFCDLFSGIKNWKSRTTNYNLVQETIDLAIERNIKLAVGKTIYDIDTPVDVNKLWKKITAFKHLQPQFEHLTRTYLSIKKFPILRKQVISVVVPTYNEEDTIKKQMDWLCKYADNIEVIVVDGGSTDNTVGIVNACIKESSRVCEMTCIESKKTGRGEALKAGFKHSRGKIILFLHADTFLPDTAFSDIRELLTDEKFVGGAFTMQFDDDSWFFRQVAKFSRFRSKNFKIYHGDQAMFFTKSALKKIGGVPGDKIMEDAIISKKIKRIGKTKLLESKVTTSSRRLKNTGKIKSVIKYFFMKTAFRLGVSTDFLAKVYK